MHAITITRPGGPDVLSWSELPDPRPAAGEVLIDVAAAGVNGGDLRQRQSPGAPPPGVSSVPGLECSGRISALGPGVDGWQVGDEVCALVAGGGYAEQVAVPSGQVLPIPDGVSLIDAASLPEVYCTVWSNVFALARLAPGETVLVHGGGGGIGTAAIQLARAKGARVFATASAAKHARCRELGAERAIDYRSEDFVEVVLAATERHGADVILDTVGASYLRRNIDALAADGRLAVIGLVGAPKTEFDLGSLLFKRGTIHATMLRGRSLAQKAAIVADVRAHVWPLFEAGRIRTVVDRYIPLTASAEAHRAMESGEVVGKVVLVR